jgi:MoaA/NifB/PqqE/SkfB family radical SAM enzyme
MCKTAKYKNIELSVHVFATSRCNLKCKHCYLSLSSTGTTFHDLPAALITCAINCIASIVGNVEFEIEGGEITLHPEFYSILDNINTEVLSKVIITTNGTQAINLDRIKKYKGLKLRVSIEGHNQTIHSILRQTKIQDQLSLVIKARKLGINTVIRTTIHKQNTNYIAEMVEVFNSSGTNEIQFLEFQQVGRGNLEVNSELVLSNKSIQDFIAKLDSINTYNVSKITLSLARPRLELARIIKVRNLIVNDKGDTKNNSLVINWDRTISKCPWHPNAAIISETYPIDMKRFIQEKIDDGTLLHECNNCSVISFTRKTNETPI